MYALTEKIAQFLAKVSPARTKQGRIKDVHSDRRSYDLDEMWFKTKWYKR